MLSGNGANTGQAYVKRLCVDRALTVSWPCAGGSARFCRRRRRSEVGWDGGGRSSLVGARVLATKWRRDMRTPLLSAG